MIYKVEIDFNFEPEVLASLIRRSIKRIDVSVKVERDIEAGVLANSSMGGNNTNH